MKNTSTQSNIRQLPPREKAQDLYDLIDKNGGFQLAHDLVEEMLKLTELDKEKLARQHGAESHICHEFYMAASVINTIKSDLWWMNYNGTLYGGLTGKSSIKKERAIMAATYISEYARNKKNKLNETSKSLLYEICGFLFDMFCDRPKTYKRIYLRLKKKEGGKVIPMYPEPITSKAI